MAELDAQQVIEKLHIGWELRNRGTGWWICEPMKAYTKTMSEPVSEAVYSQIDSDGLIEAELLTRSAVARLAK